MSRYGALPEEWEHFSKTLGLTADLLPVVANPQRSISPNSSLTDLGKVPSRLNSAGEVSGILDWTSKSTAPDAIAKWAGEPDYGICVQTRHIRAFDIDDPGNARDIVAVIEGLVGPLPKRIRKNSGKCLLVFKLAGRESKRVIETGEKTAIELLANGQQFVACGTHPSGARIEWEGGMPLVIPELTLEQVDRVWAELEKRFAVSPSTKSKASDRDTVLNNALLADPVVAALKDGGYTIRNERDGRMHITCPWAEEHSAESSDSATTYFPQFTGGYESGNFVCKHAHCSGRTIGDLRAFLGISTAATDFTPVADPLPEDTKNNNGKNEKTNKEGLMIHRAHTIEQQPISWLWPDRIARGKVTLIAGSPGLGKSQLTAYLSATVSTGVAWHDKSACRSGRVLILSAEDDPADTILPRLSAVGADLEQIGIVECVRIRNQGKLISRGFSLKDDMAALDEALGRIGGVALVVIDPISAYLGQTDSHNNSDVRALLAPVAAMASKHDTAMIGVSHLNKGAGSAIDRVNGSGAFVAAARASFLITKDASISSRRMFLPVKNNIGNDKSGLAFRIESIQLPSGINTSRIVWEDEPVLMSADEALSMRAKQPGQASALDDAKAFLAELLRGGPVLAVDVADAVRGHGLSMDTIRRAKKEMGVAVDKKGNQGAWRWVLSDFDKFEAPDEFEDLQ
ncbi:MAG: AAA family ATPase [Magnetococcus sp. YQC-9]